MLDSALIRKKTLIIGSVEQAAAVASKMLKDHPNEYEIKYVSETIDDQTFRVMDTMDVVVLCDHISSESKSEMISFCIGKQKVVLLLPELFEISLLGAPVQHFDDTLAFRIDNLQLSIESRIFKRCMDIVISAAGLLLLAPIMLAVAHKIKRYDGQSPLFTQERVTRDNEPFRLYKFRTMVKNAEQKTGPVLAAEQDNRLLPFGESLRSKRLDELPQLFNVLKGDMSIVGPRPERRFFIKQYEEVIPEFKYRLAVKAGITGLAQISGKYTTTPQDKLRFDLLYIRNYSLMLDLKIMLKTIHTIMKKEQAAGVSEEISAQDRLSEIGCIVLK